MERISTVISHVNNNAVNIAPNLNITTSGSNISDDGHSAALLIDLCDRGTLRPVRLCLATPPSAFPDCKLAHNCVNYSIVSAKYRCAFCSMFRLRP